MSNTPFAKLRPDKPLVRVTDTRVDGNLLIAESYSNWIELRRKGYRQRVTMTFDEIWRLGRKVTWKQRRAS